MGGERSEAGPFAVTADLAPDLAQNLAQNLDRIFELCSAIALAGWIMLFTAPFARVPLIRGARIMSGALAAAYVVQLATITQPVAGGGFSTLAGVVALFSVPGNIMLGWTHYLAFDLFTGAWALEDAGRIGIPHWAMIIPLALTFLLGPVGLMTYGIIRLLHQWRTRGRWV